MVSEVESIPQYLKAFKPIGLVELDKVALLDRMDTKYVFTIEQLPMFLDRLKDTYCVLEINNNSMFHYESLYFDTDAFYLFNQHFVGLNRYKVRFRKYVESNQSFFEIKFKNNKSRTVKTRIRQLLSQEIEGDALNLLETKSPYHKVD
ncbi:MAG: VTC domain-containing protein [Bacteroidetes bacterium]|nr:VTC domain-containing protein [Bacteroidota bacterium]